MYIRGFESFLFEFSNKKRVSFCFSFYGKGPRGYSFSSPFEEAARTIVRPARRSLCSPNRQRFLSQSSNHKKRASFDTSFFMGSDYGLFALAHPQGAARTIARPARRSLCSPNRQRFLSKSSNHKKRYLSIPLFYGRRLRIRTADPLGVNEML